MVLEVWCEQRCWVQKAAANSPCPIQQMGQRRIIKTQQEITVAKFSLFTEWLRGVASTGHTVTDGQG